MVEAISREQQASTTRQWHPLVGTWRATGTADAIEGGTTTSQQIQGYFVFTPWSRLAVLYGSVEGAVTEYQLAYTGTWQAAGDSIEIEVDFATSKYISKTFTRYFEIEGSKLTLKTPLHESKATPGVMKVSYLTGVRESE